MANKVEFGLSNVYVAFITTETTTGPTYTTPVAVPGAVNLALDPAGEQSSFYADNVAYYVVDTNLGYTGELDMALISDETQADMLGWQVDDNGMLIEVGDGVPTPFALLFEVEGDDAKRRYVYYKCQATRPKEEHGTKGETSDPATKPMNLVVSPVAIDDLLVVKGGITLNTDTVSGNTTAFSGFFSTVLTPTFATT